MKKTLISVFVFGCILSSFGQQEAAFSQYYNNHYSYNPAAAGLNGTSTLFGTFRRQWLGVDNGPSTGFLSFDTPLQSQNAAIGVQIAADQLLSMRNARFSGTYAYKVRLGESDISGLRFGLQLTAANLRDNSSLFAKWDKGDPLLQTAYSNMLFNVGMGAMFNTEKFYIGAGIPQIMKTKFARNNPNSQAYFQPHYYGSIGASIEAGSVQVRPSAFIKYVANAPLSAEGNLTVLLNQKLGLGFAYRTDKTMAANIESSVLPTLKLVYSYDLSPATIRSVNRGSHEIGIRYFFSSIDDLEDLKPKFTH